MQMEQWQDAASRQVELLTRRLDELLARGLELLRSELGVDLGLEPGLVPPWVIPLAACVGLVLMVCLWASVCRGLFKKRPALSPEDDDDDGGVVEVNRSVSKPVKPEEPKKKKKKADKKAQSNGRAAAEPHEEAIVSEETVPHHQQQQPAQVKADKVAEVKKSKKKAKQAVKETKAATADGKEPEEGTWETKVSNKEKREQRKKDKGSSDGSASPGGGDRPVSHPPEQPKASAAPAPSNQKKKKGESTKVKAEKVEPVVAQVNSREAAAPVTDTAAVSVPARSVSPKTSPWTTSREPASVWRGDIDESWTVIDRAVPTSELNPSFSGLGVSGGAAADGGSGDPSSDWNAPSEAWGNYEEPALKPAPEPEQSLPEPVKDDDEDEKDKGETSPDGAAKTKKKKKKKKKAAEEGGAADQLVKAANAEVKVERPMKDNNTSPKPTITQVPTDGEPTAKQNSLPAPAPQKKSEESQAPKPAKKKKARRET
ncbi:putative protein LYRIC-like isoform 2 [Scophthalmus maximus]|uniref:LYRIC protein n=1 Tax=Scophthalmus maximus TaxID=52904 RepID=A0A2U9AZU3_SCOMX|nr:putative protein LYRIC-like [Scophthalmus maximus]AWO97095.1 putative protein LYRIC-like isoform 2 [Scophthalmus maximus]